MRISLARFVSVLTPLLVCGVATLGQHPIVEHSREIFDNLPPAFDRQVAALGSRAATAGKEHTVLEGEFRDDDGVRPARVVLQPPHFARLEGFTHDGIPLSFDGVRPFRTRKLDEQLLETFVFDTAEGMLTAIRQGGAVQLLGRNVHGDSRAYDIYEVAVAVLSGPERLERLKRYAFDSDTGLLVSTEYADETVSPPSAVQIRFSDWQHAEGSAFPGRIERIENHKVAFSFTVARIHSQPRREPAAFR